MQNFLIQQALDMTTESKKPEYSPASPAVEQAARLLLCLGKTHTPEMGLTQICKQIGIHKSKGFSILNALCRHDLVTKDPKTKKYALGPALMPLARKAMEKIDINEIARPHLQELANETRASILLGIISNDQLYISSKFDGNTKLSVTVRQHQSLHITHGAHGKAIFAFLGKEALENAYQSGRVYFHGEPEDCDKIRLAQEFKTCREKGYAVDNGEITPGTRAVSAPIFDHNSRVIGAVVLVGTFDEKSLHKLGDRTAAAAQIISRQAGAQI